MLENAVDISIVVPVYNSAPTIALLATRVTASMLQAGLSYELILVDDSSSDDSWQRICDISQTNSAITGLRLSANFGQWCATIAGLSTTSGKYIVTIDDDLEYDPEDIVTLYDTITREKLSVVFGISADKYSHQGKSPFLSRLRNSILNVFWNKPLTDSYRIMRRELLFINDAFIVKEPIDAFISHSVKRWQIGYLPVSFQTRHAGKSNHNFTKKIKLFFLYNAYFIQNLTTKLFLLIIFFSLDVTAICLFRGSDQRHQDTIFLLVFILILITALGICGLVALSLKPRSPLYSFDAAVRGKHV